MSSSNLNQRCRAWSCSTGPHTGPGAPGADIGVMAAALIGDHYRPVDKFDSLHDMLTGAYLTRTSNLARGSHGAVVRVQRRRVILVRD